MNDARFFIERVRTDYAFRRECYRAGTAAEFSHLISGAGYNFSDHEMGDALRSLLLKVADEDAAAEIREIEQWYDMQTQANFTVSVCSSCSMKDSGCNGLCP
jgi:hypothetical protein